MMRAFMAVLLAALIGACAPMGEVKSARAWRPATIAAAPVSLDPAHAGARRIGALTFRGGLKLTSTDRAFGGWSGLWVGADGSEVTLVREHAISQEH